MGWSVDSGRAPVSWGLGNVPGRMCSEVPWSGQALGPSSLSPEQGTFHLSCPKIPAEGEGWGHMYMKDWKILRD